MNKLKILLSVYRDRNSLWLFFCWLVLKIKKILKIGFENHNTTIRKKVDIVIPTVSKDFLLLELVLKSLKQLRQDVNKIYIVAPDKEEIRHFCQKFNCVFVNETSVLGFGKDYIKYDVSGTSRSGWMYQQLLKLSGENFTELKDYIVIDSDTIFVRANSFYEDGKYQFFANEEWHKPYFNSFHYLFGHKAPTNLSLTSHMMIFNHDYLREMKKELESKHGKKWFDAYISTSQSGEFSCVSDYETYANWLLVHYPEKCQIVPFYNKSVSRKKLGAYEDIVDEYSNHLKSVSFHSYI